MQIEINGIKYGLDFIRPDGLKPPTTRGFMLLKGYDSKLKLDLLPSATYYCVDIHNKKVYESVYAGDSNLKWIDVSYQEIWILFIRVFKRISIEINREGEESPNNVKISLEY